MKFGFSWPSGLREDIWKHTHTHTHTHTFLHTRTQQLKVVPDDKMWKGGGALKAKHYIFVRWGRGAGGWREFFFYYYFFFFYPVSSWLL